MGWKIVGVLFLVVLVGSYNDVLGNLLIWGGIIWWAVSAWNKRAPERAAAELARQKAALAVSMDGWHEAPSGQPRHPRSQYRPGPVGSPRDTAGVTRVALRPAALRDGRTIALPDAQQARQLLGETLTDLARAVAGEAQVLAHELGTAPGGGCASASFRLRGGPLGWQDRAAGSRLTATAASLVNRTLEWSEARGTVLTALHPAGESLGQVEAAARRAVRALEDPYPRMAFPGPAERPVRPAGEWPEMVSAVQQALVRTADLLGTHPPVEPEVLLPPRDARFEGHVSPSATDEQLAAFLVARTHRYATLTTGAAELERSDWNLGGDLLAGFLTSEVRRRFERTVEGSAEVALWPADTLTTEVRIRLHLAYAAMALNYLMEVSNQMQEYTDRSGMGEPRPPVTFTGHVGQVNIAETVQIIGANIAAVMERGDDRSVAALDALNSAIQQEAALSDDQRAELLDSLADVSEAAANPTDRRLRTRARLALEAIGRAGAAIGATSPIAQAVTDWQHVYTSLF